jgi:hypothetical protein
MSDMLAKDSDLREVLATSISLVIPSRMAKPLLDVLQDPSAYTLPNKGTISRWRLLLDTSYMLYMRSVNRSRRWIRYLMVDSSTQGGRDYELTIVSSVDYDRLHELRMAALELLSLRHSQTCVSFCCSLS